MAVSPTGVYSKPLDLLRDLVAGTSAFQTWTSTANAAAAKVRVYAEGEETSNITRPCAVVWESEANTDCTGYVSGGLMLLFEADVTEAANIDARYEFTNDVGAIIEEMQADVQTATTEVLDVQSVRRVSLARSYREEGEGDYFQAIYEIRFGVGA